MSTSAQTTDISAEWLFGYDGDGNRVSQTHGSALTVYFMGGAYEVSGDAVSPSGMISGVRKYYSIAGITVAVNTCASGDCSLTTGNWSLNYLLTDHLGSVVFLQ